MRIQPAPARRAVKQHRTLLLSLRRLVARLLPLQTVAQVAQQAGMPLVATLSLELPIQGILSQPITILQTEVRAETAAQAARLRRLLREEIKSKRKATLSPTLGTLQRRRREME